jgi:hypothetical protein
MLASQSGLVNRPSSSSAALLRPVRAIAQLFAKAAPDFLGTSSRCQPLLVRLLDGLDKPIVRKFIQRCPGTPRIGSARLVTAALGIPPVSSWPRKTMPRVPAGVTSSF